jgi:hypothetical protein
MSQIEDYSGMDNSIMKRRYAEEVARYKAIIWYGFLDGVFIVDKNPCSYTNRGTAKGQKELDFE